MPEQVAELFVKFAELAAVAGATPDDGSGIDGVWTTTVPARDREDDWNVAMNADTGTQHTVENFPTSGDSPSIRPASVTVWLGGLPAGVCTPFDGAVVIQETIDGPTSIEDELIADVEAHMAAVEDDSSEPTAPTTGGEPV